MEIKTVNPIPKCCGSCRAFGTLSGARCYWHGKVFAMGICDDYEVKEEYASNNPVELDRAIEDDLCERCGLPKDIHPTQMCFGEPPGSSL